MIDFHKQLVNVLSAILPTHYELTLSANTLTPCISYQERNNYAIETGDTLGYSKLQYTIKIWANSIEVIQRYAPIIDNALRSIGFIRISSTELYDINSTMIQKIMTYEGIAQEEF